MNIRCPSCQTVFRVDPARVPAGGIRARCSRCNATFHVSRPEAVPIEAAQPPAQDEAAAATTAPPAEAPAVAPAAGAVVEPQPSPAPAPREREAEPEPAVAAAPPAPAEAAAVPVASAPAAAAASAATAAPPRPHTFGSRDPDARARRIARALVSDIIAYHPKRWETSRAANTLRAEFREEILKSWEEYVAQVGLEMAKSTPHFRAALNDILAGGQQVF